MDKKKRVLVVEDDNGIRLAISSILERQGYEVTNVTDGEKALEQVDKADVVLLDIFLPKITGDEFLRRIRNKGNMVPVVLMSAAMPEAVDRWWKLAGIESRMIAITGGTSATKIAPKTAPCREPRPPMMTSSRTWMDSRMVKMSGARKAILCANRTPASPINPAE